MDVMRDSAIEDFSRQNVAVLEPNLKASQDRFEVADPTRTDVAQYEARLSCASGTLEHAMAQLDARLENSFLFFTFTESAITTAPDMPGLRGDDVEVLECRG